MLFLLRPSRGSVPGRVISSIRSAVLVGLALLVVPYLGVQTGGHVNSPHPTALRGGAAWRGMRPVTREEGAMLNGTRIAGPVTHVRDGDTLEVRGVPVRIANLDCAERGTGAGRTATQAMRRLAGRGPLTCSLSGRRSYDREVGTCRMQDGRDIGAVLISQGVCRRWQ